MIADRWTIERRFRHGRTEFWFKYGGELHDFRRLEKTITGRMGGKVTKRLSGPAGENVVTIELPTHIIKLINDYYDLLYFSQRARMTRN